MPKRVMLLTSLIVVLSAAMLFAAGPASAKTTSPQGLGCGWSAAKTNSTTYLGYTLYTDLFAYTSTQGFCGKFFARTIINVNAEYGGGYAFGTIYDGNGHPTNSSNVYWSTLPYFAQYYVDSPQITSDCAKSTATAKLNSGTQIGPVWDQPGGGDWCP